MEDKCSLRTKTYKGFEALELSDGQVKVVIVPELGGKLTSIQDLATGREWLWANPYLPAKPVEYDASFVKTFDTGGLDECFPAVTGGTYPAFPWEGARIPDHGELWCQPWRAEIIEASWRRIIISMACRGARFPYRFERRLTLSSAKPGLQLDYSLHNLSNFDFPFSWCIHPILNIEPGMRIRLPKGTDTLRVDSGTGDFESLAGETVNWPRVMLPDGESVDLSQIPSREFGQAVKLYTPQMKGNELVETAVLDRSGEHALTFRFRPDEITHIGLWLNLGGWSGSGSGHYFNLGLEPAIGGTDGLGKAMGMGEFGVVPAAKEKRWSLEMIIS